MSLLCWERKSERIITVAFYIIIGYWAVFAVCHIIHHSFAFYFTYADRYTYLTLPPILKWKLLVSTIWIDMLISLIFVPLVAFLILQKYKEREKIREVYCRGKSPYY